MTAIDPYEPPRAGELETGLLLRDLRWRGAVWFAALPVALILSFVLLDVYESAELHAETLRTVFELMTFLVLPTSVAGYASGRRCRSTAWARYFVLAVPDALLWAIAASLLLRLSHGGISLDMKMARVVGRGAMITIPLCLLFATTLRFFYRHRP